MFGLGVWSRVLQCFSLHADGSVWDLTMAWPVGATLVLADREALLPGPGLVELLQQSAIHAVTLTPSALSVMPAAALPELRVLVAAGEVLSEEDRKSTRLNSSHSQISYAVFCLKKKKKQPNTPCN